MKRNFEIYRIKHFDTHESICKRFGIDKTQLFALNGNFELIEGRLVLIQSTKTYVVQPGDSFEAISEKTGTEISKLKEKNGTDKLFIGQILKI